MRRIFASALILTFASCTQPTIRQTQGAVDVAPVVPDPLRPLQPTLGDLKKQIWILPFSLRQTPRGPLATLPHGDIILAQTQNVFTEINSPFLLPSSEDYEALSDMNLNSSAEVRSVAKVARGSGAAGFLRGEIVELSLTDVLSPEGILRTKTYYLTLTVQWEFYDAYTGRKLSHGTDTFSYNETRSDILATGEALPELDKKLGMTADQVARRILYNVAPIADKLGWAGRVIRMESTRIYVNAGKRTGIKVGEILKVIDRPKDIMDPNGGVFLGQAPGRIKGTIKVIQHFGLDGAIGILQTGGGVQAGDRVELY